MIKQVISDVLCINEPKKMRVFTSEATDEVTHISFWKPEVTWTQWKVINTSLKATLYNSMNT